MVTDRVKGHCSVCGSMPWEMCSEHCIPAPKHKSDGGSTNYYAVPPGATDLADLIEHKDMSFALGNIFKACYRLGEKEGTDLIYDLNKIIYFAERLKKQAEKVKS